ncbi:Nuclear transcription factor Y subunit C-3 [Ananas comosus]|uniref:Nuclear transcription factor Y subunit C-3 n=1 Tax=Ananas comosus TaxID=4615 RepID=A0A199VU63_ANACO|nr:Nuclear transcription factor Y subunit C-3 [Ananas comosus]
MDPSGDGSPPPPPPPPPAIVGAGAVVPYAPFPAPPPPREAFWAEQWREVERTVDVREHILPLARIKRIMKADEDVRMVAAEAPALFARACEMFIVDLTFRAWAHAHENRRRTLQRADVAVAVARTDVFDFLLDVVSLHDHPAPYADYYIHP